jgi:hypothetical protein
MRKKKKHKNILAEKENKNDAPLPMPWGELQSK